MALTRKMLKAMGIEENIIDEIIDAHGESVDALKQQRDAYKADAEKLVSVQAELDSLKNGDDYKAKYEQEHTDFEAYKAQVLAKDTKAAKETAVRAYFESKGIKGKSLEIAIRGAGKETDAIELDGDKIKDATSLDALINGVFSGLVSSTETGGTPTPNPTGASGGSGITKEAFAKMSYSERLKLYKEQPEVYSSLTK